MDDRQRCMPYAKRGRSPAEEVTADQLAGGGRDHCRRLVERDESLLMASTRRKHVKYEEGQWFGVPLRDGGYAIGTIVRGSYRTRGGLGYFFGPRYDRPPGDEVTQHLQAMNAILVGFFGDLGIIEGRWPLIASSRPFRRDEWQVPKLGRLDPVVPTRGVLVEYDQEDDGSRRQLRLSSCSAEELVGLPQDGLYGAGAIEIALTKLLGKG